jgi:hypothetical protein
VRDGARSPDRRLYEDDAQFEPETARLAYGLGGALFLLPRAPAAVALFATAAVVLRHHVLPRWFGWITPAQATAFVVGLAAYAVGEGAFLAYVLFWLWLVVAAVALVRPASLRGGARYQGRSPVSDTKLRQGADNAESVTTYPQAAIANLAGRIV